MGGSEAKIVSEGQHEIFIQYSQEVGEESLHELKSMLGKCYPKSLISSYRHSSDSPTL